MATGDISGLHVHAGPDGWAVRREGMQSLFHAIHEPLLPFLDPFHWYAESVDGGAFNAFALDFDDRENVVKTHEHRLAILDDALVLGESPLLYRPGTMARFAWYMTDDWAVLLGLDATEEEAVRFAHGRPSSRIDSPLVDSWAFNVDGGSWEFFSRRRSLVDRLREHLNGLTGVRWEEAELSAAVAFWDTA